VQLDINKWKKELGPKLFSKMYRGFVCLSKNPEETVESQVQVTENSFIKNMTKLFGYKSEFLAKRFYLLMTGRQPGIRVDFNNYMGYL